MAGARITLTDEQVIQLSDITAEKNAAFDAGKPGVIIAQVFPDEADGPWAKVLFLEHHWAEILKALLDARFEAQG